MTMPSMVDDLNRAARENPAAAGLIGLGVLWILFGRSNVSAVIGRIPGAASTAANSMASAAGAAAQVVRDGAGLVRDEAAEAAQAVKSAIASATGDSKTATGSYTSQPSRHEPAQSPDRPASQDMTHSIATALQRNLSQALDRQPVLLGAIGLALGAGIASTFPPTQTERKMMGDKGAALKGAMREVVEDTVEEASIRVRRAAGQMKKEASAQAAILKGQLSGTAAKLAAVAESAKNTTKRHQPKKAT